MGFVDMPPDDATSTNGAGAPPDWVPPQNQDAPHSEPREARAERPRAVWMPSAEIFSPLSPTRWLSRDLQIAPGRPTLGAGYGNAGKTITSQSLALSTAVGGLIWNRFASSAGVVKHFDYEMGGHPTRKRYQRLAKGMGIDPAELEGRLELTVFPELYLNSPRAVDAYQREVEGADLVILDALRGATPGTDENDSKIRICLDNLTRVSERTGAAFLVIHHAGKPKEGQTDARMTVRGSSAIFDACGAVFVLVGGKDVPTKVSMQKPSESGEGRMLDDFLLQIEDVEVGGDPAGGVRVVCVPAAVVAANQETQRQRATDDQLAKNKRHVLQAVNKRPGATVRSIREIAGIKHASVPGVLDLLVQDGALRIQSGKYDTYWPAEVDHAAE